MRQHFSRVKGVALVVVQRRIAGRRRRNLRPERSNPLTGENFSCGKVRELRALPVFPSFVETLRQYSSQVKGVALVTVRRRIAGRRRRNLRPERSNPLTGENFSCGKVRELRALPVFPSFVETLRQHFSRVKGVALVTVRWRFARASWSTGRNFFSIFLFRPIVFFSFLIIIYSMDDDIA